MNYFEYTKTLSTSTIYEILEVVNSLKGYAIKIYKGLAQDALDAAFNHIIKNYDENSGELEHYATKVVGKILLRKFAREVEIDGEILEGIVNKKKANVGYYNPEGILDSLTAIPNTVDACVNYLLPFFIQDYKFFKTRKAEDRRLEYNGIFNKFSYSVINESMNQLVNTYGEDMEYLLELKSNCHYRNFPSDRYLKSLDENVEYVDTVEGIILYKKNSSRLKRFIYCIDIKDALYQLKFKLYREEYKRVIGDITVYCTLSGQLVTDENELNEILESELVGALLARAHSTMGVLRYDRGSSLMLSSNRAEEKGFLFEIGSKLIYVPVVKKASKCVCA